MSKKTERVNQMMQGYMQDRQNGLSNVQVAQKYGISKGRLYGCLQEIAEKKGVTREALLDYPDKSHTFSRSTVSHKKESVDPLELKKNFNGILEQLSDVIQKISQLEGQEEKQ